MLRIYLPPISPEDKVALICIGVIIVCWVVWVILMKSRWADTLHLFQIEELLWRKHGISVTGIFMMMLIMIVVLYFVWVILGQL